ncbi:amidohydrolase family protein [Actinotignum timonense]|uniref:N-acetylglucosamine-6-phosphate deacetylase n=1 Tax=Actinotignum timonense TaxID=1870995 RepID=UPI0025510293|nr:amidohydrolase family protein [Actinotignum timonense]
MFYLGRVLNGYGREVGYGIETDDAGTLARVLTAEEAAAVTAGLAAERDSRGIEARAAEAFGLGADNPRVRRAHVITPGLVDIHCHGGGGFAFPDNYADEEIATAIRTHQRGGTTAMFASLVSLADPLPQIEALVPFCERGELAGIHLEGPYISREKCGAQNPEVIRPVDEAELRSWLEAGRGWIKTMTVAPEAEGAQRAAELLLEYGGKPSWGHSHGDGAITRAEIARTLEVARRHGYVPLAACGEAGGGAVGQEAAQTVTHLFNAMTAFTHRAPGPIREYIQAARRGFISAEVIADGYHVHPDLVEDVVAYLDEPELGAGFAGVHGAGNGAGAAGAGAGQLGIPGAFFVTDSLAAAGMPPGKYTLGGLAVEVRDGACYLEGTDTLAGGASVLADQVALFAGRGKLTLPQLVRATVAGPVYAGGAWDAPGVTVDFTPGKPVNLVAWNEAMTPLAVVREGVEISHS